MASELPALTVAYAATWRAWLGDHHNESGGVWLVLAKKGRTDPTRLTYEEALQEALAHGWIDGQVRRGDEHSYRQRFTPRRARSVWSKRNVEIVERLLAEGRTDPSGVLQMQRAKEDGRWASAYAGPANIEVPSAAAGGQWWAVDR